MKALFSSKTTFRLGQITVYALAIVGVVTVSAGLFMFFRWLF